MKVPGLALLDPGGGGGVGPEIGIGMENGTYPASSFGMALALGPSVVAGRQPKGPN